MKLNLFYQIEQRINFNNKAYVIGINGVDTSGKTFFSNELAYFLTRRGYKIQQIHMDDFHNISSVRYQGNNPIDSYLDYAFNLESIENELLKDIANGKTCKKTLQLLDLDSDQYTNRKVYDIDKNTVVLFEGVLLYRLPLLPYFDLKLYLDISFEEVIKRATERDGKKYGMEFVDKYKEKYIPIQQKYMETYKPKEISDLLIDNSDFNNPVVK